MIKREPTEYVLSKNKKTLLIIHNHFSCSFKRSYFLLCIPRIFTPESPTMARDFSAYYIGAWRLFHNPAQVYQGGCIVERLSDYNRTIKISSTRLHSYSFSPFLTLNYQEAFVAFDIIQIVLIALLGFFVYKLVKDKNVVLGTIAAVVVLIEPLPSLPLTKPKLTFFITDLPA